MCREIIVAPHAGKKIRRVAALKLRTHRAITNEKQARSGVYLPDGGKSLCHQWQIFFCCQTADISNDELLFANAPVCAQFAAAPLRIE